MLQGPTRDPLIEFVFVPDSSEMSGKFFVCFQPRFLQQGRQALPFVLCINGDDAPAVVTLALVRTVRRRHQATISLGFWFLMIDGILQIFRAKQRCADLDLSAVDPLAASGFLPLNKR